MCLPQVFSYKQQKLMFIQHSVFCMIVFKYVLADDEIVLHYKHYTCKLSLQNVFFI
uniref:Uncharacterized protein n=1 Tax=Arion vulgaris TaxID=1028688 RepID=A0A0B7ANT9_9EUPU